MCKNNHFATATLADMFQDVHFFCVVAAAISMQFLELLQWQKTENVCKFWLQSTLWRERPAMLKQSSRCSMARRHRDHGGHDLSEFYEGGLEKGGFSKLNLKKVRRRPGGGGGRTLKA